MFRYEGYSRRGHLQGIGKVEYSNGVTYDGSWKYSQYNGYGELNKPAAGIRYRGWFKNGEYEGKGQLLIHDVSCYKGMFREGFKEGHGTLFYPNGNFYEGEWSRDKKHGKGVFVNMRLGFIFKGNYFRGRKDGRGKMILADQTVIKSYWKKDRNDGYGEIRSHIGVYRGDCLDLKAHSCGKMIYSNGDHYEGEFSENLRHGEGKLTLASGRIIAGNWHRDVRLLI